MTGRLHAFTSDSLEGYMYKPTISTEGASYAAICESVKKRRRLHNMCYQTQLFYLAENAILRRLP